MSSEKAFPEIFTDRDQYGNYDVYSCGGMTLRDYFAGQALIGWVDIHGGDSDAEADQNVAAQCYRIADAMMEAREVKNNG